jgi:hypothetical protein
VANVLRSLDSDSHAKPSKPWIEDFDEFAKAHPGRWIVGRSARPCTSQAEANETARADATREVDNLVRKIVASSYSNNDWLARRVDQDVQAGELQSDSATEQFLRPYGTIWIGSVLVDASPQRLDSLIKRYAREAQDRTLRASKMRSVAAAFALAAWLGYFVLNGLTKGYFTTGLRFAAAMMTAAVIVFLV